MCNICIHLYVFVGARSVWYGAGQHSATLLWYNGDHPNQEGGLSNQIALSQLPIEVSYLPIITLSIFEEKCQLQLNYVKYRLSHPPVQLSSLKKRIVSVPLTTHHIHNSQQFLLLQDAWGFLDFTDPCSHILQNSCRIVILNLFVGTQV